METNVDKDPLSYEWLTYLWVIVLSLWGGIANYFRNITSGNPVRFSLAELIGDVVISGFVGLLTFFFCEAAQVKPMWAAGVIGITAHMGSRALFMMEKTLSNLIASFVARFMAKHKGEN